MDDFLANLFRDLICEFFLLIFGPPTFRDASVAATALVNLNGGSMKLSGTSKLFILMWLHEAFHMFEGRNFMYFSKC